MKVEKTKIPSSKGNLAAVIHYPEKKREKLAMLCSGYLDSKDYKHLVGLAETLCKEGYTVVRFDSIFGEKWAFDEKMPGDEKVDNLIRKGKMFMKVYKELKEKLPADQAYEKAVQKLGG